MGEAQTPHDAEWLEYDDDTRSAAQFQFVHIRFTRRVPTIHLGWHFPFEGEKRLTTLCGQTALVTIDDSIERMCATCKRMADRAENSRLRAALGGERDT